MLDDGCAHVCRGRSGQGPVLGLIRAIDKSVAMFNVEDEKSLENVFSGLL